MQLSMVYILCGSVLEGVVVWPCAAQWRGYGVQLSGVKCVELQWRGGWGQVGQGHASSELLQLLH